MMNKVFRKIIISMRFSKNKNKNNNNNKFKKKKEKTKKFNKFKIKGINKFQKINKKKMIKCLISVIKMLLMLV